MAGSPTQKRRRSSHEDTARPGIDSNPHAATGVKRQRTSPIPSKRHAPESERHPAASERQPEQDVERQRGADRRLSDVHARSPAGRSRTNDHRKMYDHHRAEGREQHSRHEDRKRPHPDSGMSTDLDRGAMDESGHSKAKAKHSDVHRKSSSGKSHSAGDARSSHHMQNDSKHPNEPGREQRSSAAERKHSPRHHDIPSRKAHSSATDDRRSHRSRDASKKLDKSGRGQSSDADQQKQSHGISDSASKKDHSSAADDTRSRHRHANSSRHHLDREQSSNAAERKQPCRHSNSPSRKAYSSAVEDRRPHRSRDASKKPDNPDREQKQPHINGKSSSRTDTESAADSSVDGMGSRSRPHQSRACGATGAQPEPGAGEGKHTHLSDGKPLQAHDAPAPDDGHARSNPGMEHASSSKEPKADAAVEARPDRSNLQDNGGSLEQACSPNVDSQPPSGQDGPSTIFKCQNSTKHAEAGSYREHSHHDGNAASGEKHRLDPSFDDCKHRQSPHRAEAEECPVPAAREPTAADRQGFADPGLPNRRDPSEHPRSTASEHTHPADAAQSSCLNEEPSRHANSAQPSEAGDQDPDMPPGFRGQRCGELTNLDSESSRGASEGVDRTRSDLHPPAELRAQSPSAAVAASGTAPPVNLSEAAEAAERASMNAETASASPRSHQGPTALRVDIPKGRHASAGGLLHAKANVRPTSTRPLLMGFNYLVLNFLYVPQSEANAYFLDKLTFQRASWCHPFITILTTAPLDKTILQRVSQTTVGTKGGKIQVKADQKGCTR